MGQKILAFEIKRDKREKLQKICDDLGITLMYISSEYYEQQLGALAAIKGFKKKHYTPTRRRNTFRSKKGNSQY